MIKKIKSIIKTSHTIFLFDSGIGGFSILNYIKENFPTVNYIYLLDNESFPYGNKNEAFIINRSIQIITKIQKMYPISMVIIACNTVSTITLSILRKKFFFPILGVIPLIKEAYHITKNNIVGLIATEATIKNIYIQKIIKKYYYLNSIHIIATNELAKIAEQKIRKIPILEIKLKKIFYPWMILPKQPDTIILGCTHFTFLKINIQKIFYQKIMFIDASYNIVSKIKNVIKKIDNNKIIKKNIFLYTQKNYELKKILYFLKRYNFQKIEKISI